MKQYWILFAFLISIVLLTLIINKKREMFFEMRCIKHPVTTPSNVNCDVHINYCPSSCIKCPSMKSNKECLYEKEKDWWTIQ